MVCKQWRSAALSPRLLRHLEVHCLTDGWLDFWYQSLLSWLMRHRPAQHARRWAAGLARTVHAASEPLEMQQLRTCVDPPWPLPGVSPSRSANLYFQLSNHWAEECDELRSLVAACLTAVATSAGPQLQDLSVNADCGRFTTLGACRCCTV